jgi:hypothetical protein
MKFYYYEATDPHEYIRGQTQIKDMWKKSNRASTY